MINKWVNKKYLNAQNIKQIRNKFLKAKPYPHFVLKDFLNKNKISELRKAVLEEQFEKQDMDLFSFYNTKELKFSNKDILKEFAHLLSSKNFFNLVKKLTNEKNLENIDMHAHLYKQGDYLLFHDDVVEGRKIAYILYISEGFSAKDGGKLELYDVKNPKKPLKSIIPNFNSFLCFKVSKKSLHAVEEVRSDKQRLTIGGWFYGH